MSKKESEAKFHLKVAKGMIDDVLAQVGDIEEILSRSRDKFTRGIVWTVAGGGDELDDLTGGLLDISKSGQDKQKAQGLVNNLVSMLNTAIQEASKAPELAATAKVELEGKQWTEKAVRGYAHHMRGNILLCTQNYEEALNAYDEAISCKPSQRSLMGIGVCQYQCIRYTAEEVISTLRKLVDIDPESDLAVGAGKWITRLYRDKEKLSRDLEHMSRLAVALHNEVESLKETIEGKYEEAGHLAFRVMSRHEAPSRVENILDQIDELDDTIIHIRQEIRKSKQQEPSTKSLGKTFFKSLRDKVTSTTKSFRSELDIAKLEDEKAPSVIELGKELYACHNDGIATPVDLNSIWEKVILLEQQLKEKETELASLKRSMERLQSLLQEED